MAGSHPAFLAKLPATSRERGRGEGSGEAERRNGSEPSSGTARHLLPEGEGKNKHRAAIEAAMQGVLDARAKFPYATLADLYDPLSMPPALVKAHQAPGRAVDAVCIVIEKPPAANRPSFPATPNASCSCSSAVKRWLRCCPRQGRSAAVAPDLCLTSPAWAPRSVHFPADGTGVQLQRDRSGKHVPEQPAAWTGLRRCGSDSAASAIRAVARAGRKNLRLPRCTAWS